MSSKIVDTAKSKVGTRKSKMPLPHDLILFSPTFDFRTSIFDFHLFSRPMIGYLKGDFVWKSPAVVQIDVNGVGYEVQISLNTYSKIQQSEKGMLYTHLLV